jgi:hypothetical protein
MTFVEPNLEANYPPFAWARDIRVKPLRDELEVTGTALFTDPESFGASDFLRDYRHAIRRHGPQKREGKNSPHVRFANAERDEDLINFVSRFGPVVVSSLRIEEREAFVGTFEIPGSDTLLVTRQNLAELRREHRAYRAALRIVAQLQLGKRCDVTKLQEYLPEIIESVDKWPQQWEREKHLRAAEPLWKFGHQNVCRLELWRRAACRKSSGDPFREAVAVPADPIRAAHLIICELVNAFNPVVYPWGTTPVEAPQLDLNCGIRPLLYYALRQEYLVKGRGLSICENIDCQEVFQIERCGQKFCGERCSRLQRQREYWGRRGRRLRGKRLRKR